MKIYLSDCSSLIEALYLQSISEEGEVQIVSSMSDADTIIGCNPSDVFYDKTIIINLDNYVKSTLEELASFNKVISRFPLEKDLDLEYELIPYLPDNKIHNLDFDGSTRNVMSRVSIKSFILIKSNSKYKIKKPQMFLNKKVNNYNTIIGLLSEQV